VRTLPQKSKEGGSKNAVVTSQGKPEVGKVRKPIKEDVLEPRSVTGKKKKSGTRFKMERMEESSAPDPTAGEIVKKNAKNVRGGEKARVIGGRWKLGEGALARGPQTGLKYGTARRRGWGCKKRLRDENEQSGDKNKSPRPCKKRKKRWGVSPHRRKEMAKIEGGGVEGGGTDVKKK